MNDQNGEILLTGNQYTTNLVAQREHAQEGLWNVRNLFCRGFEDVALEAINWNISI